MAITQIDYRLYMDWDKPPTRRERWEREGTGYYEVVAFAEKQAEANKRELAERKKAGEFRESDAGS